jgi:hypothetical protein
VYAAGFSSGAEFTSTEISGNVTVYCNGSEGFDTANYNCYGNYLSPAEFDYFVTDGAIDATQVTIKSKISGKTVKQSRDYNKAKARSSQRFNLWIRTITQTPLLGYGENTLKYELKKSGKVVETGEFLVNVDRAPERQCERRTMHSSDSSDCRTRSSYICDQYFRQQNYCEN